MKKHQFFNFYKIFMILMFCFMSLGFRTFGGNFWKTSEAEPYLWIKLCHDDYAHNFPVGDLPSTDEIYSSTTTVPIVHAVNSIINSVNGLELSYLILESYPYDPDNVPTTMAFTKLKAEQKTIEVCFTKGGFAGVSHAKVQLSGKDWIGCTMSLNKSKYHDDLSGYLGVFSHELGHCLGLDHPQETVHAVMSYFNSSERRRYQDDDKMGIITLFPASISFPDTNLKEKMNLGLRCSTSH